MRNLPQLISRCYETHMNSFEKTEVKTSNCKNKFELLLHDFHVFVDECHASLNKLAHLILKAVSTRSSLLHQNIRVASIPLPGTLNPIDKPFSSKEKK